ncbi:MAG: FHA domain-containing protein [Deltaproteobacteria bacterium]
MTPSRGPAAAPGGAVIELTVRLGQSPLPRVAYQQGLPPTRSTVGSGPSVEWPVSAPGVEPRHAEFAWDGKALWVRDAGSQRGTFVNGVRITADWVQVQPGNEVRLGQASIVASSPAPAPQHARHAAQSASTPFDDDLPTQMVSDTLVPMAPLPRAPSTSMGPGDAGIAERTVIVQSPYEQQSQPGARPASPMLNFAVTDPHGAPPASSVPLPRFGKTLPPSAGLRAPAAPAPDDGESTVAFSIPDERSPAPPPMFNPTPFAPMSHGPMSPGQMPGGTPGMAPGFQGGFAPMPASMTQPPSMPTGFPGAGSSSAPSIFGSIPPPPPPEAPAPKPVFTLPKRTLFLLGATMLAAIGVLMLNPKHPPPDPHANPVNTVVAAPPPPVARPAFTPPVPGPPAGPTGVLMAATTAAPPAPPDPPDPHARRAPEPPPPVDTPERIAANTLAQSRFREAIPLYDQLALAHPETPVYAQIAQILRRKVETQSQNCVPGSTTQCAPTTAAQP